MQKINKKINDSQLNNKKESNDSIKELVEGFEKEKYNVQKTKEERKTFKKQLFALIIVIIIAIGSIVGASFAIYYAKNKDIKQSTTSLVNNKKMID